jgi:hypothetical protein
VAGKVGTAQLERVVAEAIKRFDLAEPDRAADPEDGYLYVDPRHATLNDYDVHYAGTMHFEADLEIADAMDLDRALAHGAESLKALGSGESLKALGSGESLDARRAAALGDLARTQTALDLHTQGGAAGPRDGRGPDGLPAAREVVLHAHFTAESVHDGHTVFGPTGRLEERQRLLLLEQVQGWCADSRTKVTIKPVIDLTAELTTAAYEVPDRLRDQVLLRDRTCVFPWCGRPARGCDVDLSSSSTTMRRLRGRPQPGPTTTSNLAALCRFHHRLKTFTAWHYRTVAPGVFEWTSPHGHHYRRDRDGTTCTDPPGRP